ncbi:MAG: polymerase sigma factor, FliA/WhiG/SigD family [Myxococcales bacterium]|nr:polymerase sigma factor, FliA/WhiG/SigD family [Myxococcales bacterium]
MRLSDKDRQKLVDANVPFVRSIAGKIREQLPREIEFDDLYNYGMQGLLEAAERYDRRHGVTFQTFAYYRVRGAMFDGLRNMGWLPRHEYQRMRFEERAVAYLSNLAEREAGAETPAVVNIEDEMRHLAEALGGVAAIFVTSLEGKMESGDTAVGTTPAPQMRMESTERDVAVEEALKTLPEKERRLLQLYYFEDRPLEEVGKIMGLSKSWSSRLHARAIDLLKESLSSRVAPDGAPKVHKPRARR